MSEFAEFRRPDGSEIWVNPDRVIAIFPEPESPKLCRLIVGPGEYHFITVQCESLSQTALHLADKGYNVDKE